MAHGLAGRRVGAHCMHCMRWAVLAWLCGEVWSALRVCVRVCSVHAMHLFVIGRKSLQTWPNGCRDGRQRPRCAFAVANSVAVKRPSVCQRMSSDKRAQSSSLRVSGRAGGTAADAAVCMGLAPADSCARCTLTTGRAACAAKSVASMSALAWYHCAAQCGQGCNVGSRSAAGIGHGYVITFQRLRNCSFSRGMQRPVWRASMMGYEKASAIVAKRGAVPVYSFDSL